MILRKGWGVYAHRRKNYEPRSIDLDVLFYDDRIVETATLQIPHPQMVLRQFVLQPLHDIAPGKIHPKLFKTISELLEECDDESVPIPVREELQNPSVLSIFSKYNYIAIEGNIGAERLLLLIKLHWILC